MRSPFRPARTPDPAILDDHRPLIRSLERRGLIRGGLSLGALTMLTGCDVSDSTSVGKALRAVSAWNDRVQAAIFDPNHLAPEYPASMVLKPPRFNAYYDIEDLKPVEQAWDVGRGHARRQLLHHRGAPLGQAALVHLLQARAHVVLDQAYREIVPLTTCGNLDPADAVRRRRSRGSCAKPEF